MEIFARLATMLERDGAAALVTLAEVRGSSPRAPGAHMVVRTDGAFSGTIGGGTLEWQAMAEAQRLMVAPGRRVLSLDRALGPDLGQCCGGRVAVTIERLDRSDLAWIGPLAAAGDIVTAGRTDVIGILIRRPATAAEADALPPGVDRLCRPDGMVLERFGPAATPLALFGAGHVGRAVAMALAPLPFRVVWVDPRPAAFPEHTPSNVATRGEAEPATLLPTLPDGGLVLIMTHSHALDLELALAALSAQRFGAVGVIGSATKRARFLSRMRSAGLPPEVAETMICPIGLPGITGKEPTVIAASVAAQCLMWRQAAMAVGSGLSRRLSATSQDRERSGTLIPDDDPGFSYAAPR